MSITAQEYLSILQAKPQMQDVAEPFDYEKLLEQVRGAIATNHATELAQALNHQAATKPLHDLILQYCVEFLKGIAFAQDELVEKIYQDMAGLGLLTTYIYDPEVEEVNVNGYNVIEISYPDRTEFLYGKDAFPSPVAALDTVKKMVRMGGVILDSQSPRVDSYIGGGTRISAMIPPAVPAEKGVVVSIRKQSKSDISRGQLVTTGSATNQILDFLSLCLCNGVSVGLAGGTGAGKTTDQAYLINDYIRNNDDANNRIYVIEDSRELNLVEYDHLHNRPARVLYATTKGEPNPITMMDLIVSSLRFHPKLIVPAEVRDGAAYEAALAGQTGHTILTAFHADSAVDGYARLVSMCHLANTGLSDTKLLELCASAWPIMVHKKQLKDGSRKYMEVFEATGVVDGKLEGNGLYQFVIQTNQRNDHGQIIKVEGEHRQIGQISKGLRQRFLDNGVTEATLDALFAKEVKS